MPEDQIVQVNFGEVRLVPAQERHRPKRGLSLTRLSEVASGLWTLIIRTALIGSVLAVLAVTASEVMRDTFVIEELGLPEPLVKMGYSGTVGAYRLWDSTQWINELSGTTKDRASLIAASRQIEITEPGTGLSLSGLVQVIRRLVGREQPRIAGEFVCRDAKCSIEEMELRLRAFQNGAMTVSGVGRLGVLETDAEIDAYFDRAALALLGMIDPYVRVSFLYEVEENDLPEDAIDRATALVASLGPLPSDVAEPRSAMEARALLSRQHPHRAWAALFLSNRAHESGKSEAAFEWATRSISFMETDRIAPFPNAYDAWGNSLGDLGRHEEANEKYQAALEIDPDYAYAYNNWGNSLGALGRHEEANEKYQAALEIDPDYAYAYNGWGNRLGALGRHEEAIEKYKSALEIDPDYTYAYNGWGYSLGALGRHEEAIEKYQAALAIDPDYANANNGWINALDRLVDGAGPDRCAVFAAVFERLERSTVAPERADALIARFGETREVCTPPSASEFAELESIKIDSSTIFPLEKSVSIGPKAQWIQVIGDLPRETVTIRLASPEGDPYLQAFDSNHHFVAENDDDPHNGSLDSILSIQFIEEYYLLRARSLRQNETLATLSIDYAEERLVSGD